jgi:hypothetical protein
MLDDVGRGDLALVEFRLRYLEDLMAQSLDHIIPCTEIVLIMYRHIGTVIQLQDLPFGV